MFFGGEVDFFLAMGGEGVMLIVTGPSGSGGGARGAHVVGTARAAFFHIRGLPPRSGFRG